MILHQLKCSFGDYSMMFIVIIATLTSISDGMQIAWIYPSESSIEVYKLVPEEDYNGLYVSFIIGNLVGLTLVSYLSDKFGRKLSILLASIIKIKSWLWLMFGSATEEYIYVGRLLAGLGFSINLTCITMYVGEITHQLDRGFFSCIYGVLLHIGMLIIFVIGPIYSISTTAVFGILFPIVQVLLCWMIPESPYFLLMKNKEILALESFKILRPNQGSDLEWEAIKLAVLRQKSETGRIQEFFIKASNLKPFIILIILSAVHHFLGRAVINLNTATDLGSLFKTSFYTSNITMAAIKVIFTICGAFLMDIVGRKYLLMLSALGTGITLLILTIYYNIINVELLSTIYWLPAVLTVTFTAFYRIGIPLVPLVLLGELFPLSVKNFGTPIINFTYLVFEITSLSLYHQLTKAYGPQIPVQIFGACSIGAVVFTAVYIPETKGKTLEEIQMLLKGNNTMAPT